MLNKQINRALFLMGHFEQFAQKIIFFWLFLVIGSLFYIEIP